MEHLINKIKLSENQKIQYYFVYGTYWNNELISLDLETVSISLKIAANLFSGDIFKINLNYLKEYYSPKSTYDYVSAIKEIYNNNVKRLLNAHYKIANNTYSEKLFLDTDFKQFEPFWKQLSETTKTSKSYSTIIIIDDNVASNYKKYIKQYHPELYRGFYGATKVSIICNEDNVLINNVKLPKNSFATFECEQYFESHDYVNDSEILEKYNERLEYCIKEFGTEYCIIIDELAYLKKCPKTFETFYKDKQKYKYYRDCDTEITSLSKDVCFKIVNSMFINRNKLVDNYEIFANDLSPLLTYNLFELYDFADIDKNILLIQQLTDLNNYKINNNLFYFFLIHEFKNFK